MTELHGLPPQRAALIGHEIRIEFAQVRHGAEREDLAPIAKAGLRVGLGVFRAP